MATLIPSKVTETGVGLATDAYADTNGDEFLNTGIEFLRIKNDHASGTYSVRITAQTTSIKHPTYGALTKSNTEISLANGSDALIGPFKQGSWNDSNNKIQITYRTTGCLLYTSPSPRDS